MAKRFIDTEIFRKQFVRGLPAPYKLLWIYVFTNCDNAGIWYVDKLYAKSDIGEDTKFDIDTAIRLFNEDEIRIISFDRGKKWFILPFIEFQYGVKLNYENKAHRSVIEKLKILEDEGLIEFQEGVIKLLSRCFEGPMDKDKDKDIDKEKEKNKEKEKKKKEKKEYAEAVTMTEDEYNKLMSDYGEDCTTWCIDKLNNYKLSNGKKYKSDYRTILNWVTDEYRKSHGGLDNSRQSIKEREKQQRDLEFAEYAQELLNGGVP